MKNKGILSVLLCAVLLISFMGIFSASAVSWNGFGYKLYFLGKLYEPGTITAASTVVIVSADQNLTTIAVPASIDGKTVTQVQWLGPVNTVKQNTKATTISIPASVYEINIDTLALFKNLTSITVDAGNSNYASYDGVLYNKEKTKMLFCPGGKSGTVTLPSSLTSLGAKAFLGAINTNNQYAGCPKISAFSMSTPSSAYSTQDGVLMNKAKTTIVRFPRAKSGTGYTIPASVQTIGKEAFSNCAGVTKITIPGTVKNIGNKAFYGCPITTITLGNGVVSIEDGAFQSCKKLTAVSLPSSIRKIGKLAFYDCTALKTVVIADGVSGAKAACFAGCTALTEITIPGSIKDIPEEMFYGCTALKKVTLRKGIKTIGDGAFAYCVSLSKLALSDDLTTIGERAFEWTASLTTLTVPASVKKAGSGAFENSALENVTFYGTRWQWMSLNINVHAFIPCKIDVYSSRSGTAAGGKVYDLGTTATLEATSKKAFLGWYDPDGKLITKKNPYSFETKKARTFIAMFEGDVFYDIPKKAWYLQSAMEAYEQGLVSGTNLITFSAEKTLTRAEMVTLLARLEGVEASGKATTVFKDVPQKSWYTGAVAWAYKNNIVAGVSKTEFAPAAVATREQFITILMRYLTGYKKMKIGRASLPYSDAKSVSPFARASMERAQCIGLVQGTDGKVRPQATITRAESVSLIMRVKNYIESQTSNE